MAAIKTTAAAPIPAAIVAEVLDALKPASRLAPAGAVRKRLLDRVAAERRGADAGLKTIRAAGGWQAFERGVDMKVLFDDGHTRTWLARMRRNARLPAHDHEGYEECLVLKGTVYLGKVRMRGGDYQVASPGTRHGEIFSPTGCLLLIRSPSA